MKSSVRTVVAAVVIVCVLGWAGLAWAQTKETTKTEEVYVKKTTLVEKVKGGEIDWGKEMFYASGEGAMPPVSQEPNRAKAYLKAKGYGRMMAIANLLMVVEGVNITYDGTGKDYMAQDETLRAKIEGFVRGVEVLREEKTTAEGDTIVKVTVGTRMYGKANPGTAFLEKVAEIASAPEPDRPKPMAVQVEVPQEPPKPVEPIAEPAAPATAEQEGPFTSVIIDARGYKVTRAMSPKLRKADGSEAWGTVHVSPDFVLDHGIVSYARTMEAARQIGRCGENPLIVKAIGRAGGKAMCDAVVSDADADRILAENAKTKFLDQCKVIFIVDPPTYVRSGK